MKAMFILSSSPGRPRSLSQRRPVSLTLSLLSPHSLTQSARYTKHTIISRPPHGPPVLSNIKCFGPVSLVSRLRRARHASNISSLSSTTSQSQRTRTRAHGAQSNTLNTHTTLKFLPRRICCHGSPPPSTPARFLRQCLAAHPPSSSPPPNTSHADTPREQMERLRSI